MSEYIKKEDALKRPYKLWNGSEYVSVVNEDYLNNLQTYSIPDSAENNGEDSKVAKGQWIKIKNGYKCSECGHIMDKVLSVSGNLIYQYSNYCPDCGADMRDEDVSGIFKGQTSISLEGLDKWSIEEAGKIKLKGDKAE